MKSRTDMTLQNKRLFPRQRSFASALQVNVCHVPPPAFDPNVLPPKGFEAAVLEPKPVLLVFDPKPNVGRHVRHLTKQLNKTMTYLWLCCWCSQILQNQNPDSGYWYWTRRKSLHRHRQTTCWRELMRVVAQLLNAKGRKN